MPKAKRDPFLKCLDYFETAPIEAAKIALTLAADKVQKRMVESGEVKPKIKKKTDRRVEKPLHDREFIADTESH
jgi:hypothetical protein